MIPRDGLTVHQLFLPGEISYQGFELVAVPESPFPREFAPAQADACDRLGLLAASEENRPETLLRATSWVRAGPCCLFQCAASMTAPGQTDKQEVVAGITREPQVLERNDELRSPSVIETLYRDLVRDVPARVLHARPQDTLIPHHSQAVAGYLEPAPSRGAGVYSELNRVIAGNTLIPSMAIRFEFRHVFIEAFKGHP